MHIQHKDQNFTIHRKDAKTLVVNGQEIDLGKSSSDKLMINGKEYMVEVVETENKTKKVYVNNFLIDFEVKTDLEHKLDQMGIKAVEGMQASEIVAPMPGKIIDVLVAEGQNVSQGEAVLILEAMKMENGIKIEGDAEIKEILVSKGDTVDKGQKLILLK
ncbi:MAG: biotin/lipoyl-containing protein [Crocinitomicaceae bacterium]